MDTIPVPAKPHYRPTSAQMWGDVPAFDAAAHQAADSDDPAMAAWQPMAGSADADLLDELGTIVSRSRDLSRNNGLASGANQTMKDNIVGARLRLSAKPDARLLGWDQERAAEWATDTEAQFRTWAETKECDAARSATFRGLTIQAIGSAFLNGEALAIVRWLPRRHATWSTRLQLVESDRLATPPGRENRDNLRGGIEIDRYGAPRGYWIRKRHPGDQLAGYALGASAEEYVRFDAFTRWGRPKVIHLHDKERTGQSRGKPLVTAVMRQFRMAGEYSQAELQAAFANSLVAAFLESDLDQTSAAALFTSSTSAGGTDLTGKSYWNKVHKEYRPKLRPGAVIPLPMGAKLSGYTPGRPNAGFEGFMDSMLRHIAAGLNLPYELLTKDFSKSNYSSARAALLEAWRFFQSRRTWLKENWLDPIYGLWMEEAVNAGRIDAPGYYEQRYAYERAKWIFAGRGWVDPRKEAEASVLRMQNGLSTMEQECAEQGLDYEEVLEQRAREIKLMQQYEMDPSAVFGPGGTVMEQAA